MVLEGLGSYRLSILEPHILACKFLYCLWEWGAFVVLEQKPGSQSDTSVVTPEVPWKEEV